MAQPLAVALAATQPGGRIVLVGLQAAPLAATVLDRVIALEALVDEGSVP